MSESAGYALIGMTLVVVICTGFGLLALRMAINPTRAAERMKRINTTMWRGFLDEVTYPPLYFRISGIVLAAAGFGGAVMAIVSIVRLVTTHS